MLGIWWWTCKKKTWTASYSGFVKQKKGGRGYHLLFIKNGTFFPLFVSKELGIILNLRPADVFVMSLIL
jgi:hypothetical protein